MPRDRGQDKTKIAVMSRKCKTDAWILRSFPP